MELRHLRYYIAVADALNFTRAAEKLHVAQPALSKQVQDLEDEIGVDLFKRSQRGVTLTAEGRLFLDEARNIVAAADSAVLKTRALARGEFGELNIGYAPSPSIDFLPPALAAFQKAAPQVSVHLHDLAGNELCDGLRAGSLELAVMVRPRDGNSHGVLFELLHGYPMCVAVPPSHELAKARGVTVERMAEEPLVAYSKRDYADYHVMLDEVFAALPKKPKIVVECDSASSLITAIESGRGIAMVPQIFERVVGSRLKLRPLKGTAVEFEVGISTATNGDLTPAGEKFCQHLRKVRA